MRIIFSSRSWSEYLYWQEHDEKIVLRINLLVRDTTRSPFVGIGKPEPLKDEMAGWWSRRINQEQRFVYRVIRKGEAQALEIAACRFHYRR